MRTILPFAVAEPKTRLAPVLSPGERRAFARAMLDQVITRLCTTGRNPEVLATEPIDVDTPVIVDEKPLDPAVNDVLDKSDEPVAIVMPDLALATTDTLARLFTPDADVVIAPGRGGGTNAFVARHSDFRVDYHDASIRDHRRIARSITDDVVEVDSYRLATDVDVPDDLAEVLLHGDGSAAEWLRDAGFAIAVDDGRVGVQRAPNEVDIGD